MYKKLLILIIPLLIFAGPLVAQDGPSGELVIALPNDPTSLFMPRAADRTASNAAWTLYNSLIWIDENDNIVPALAESWEISEDGTEYIFHLREGVSFHNGEPFNSDSVLASWDTGLEPTNDYSDRWELATTVEALDEFTVRVTTPVPNPTFLGEVANNWAMVPPEYIAEVGIEGFEAAPVGTGPFQFVERTSGDRIVVEANPNYWEEGLPKLERVVFRIIPDSTTRLAAIQTGEIDIAPRLNADEAARLEDNADLNILSFPTNRIYYVAFKNLGNGVGTPLEDVRVRQAMNYAVNRPGIVDAIFGGQAILVSGFNFPGVLGHDDSIEPYPYDPDRARELLAEAGFAEGFEISMGCPTDAYLNINLVCLQVQRDLAAVGIEVSVEFRTTNSYWSAEAYGNTGPMFVDSWSSILGESLNRLEGALNPGNFYAAWNDDTLTDLISQIGSTVDREERGALYMEIQRVMYDDPPFIYLYAPNAIEAVSVDVEGYQPRAAEEFYLHNVVKVG